jgi:hypothetical protein
MNWSNVEKSKPIVIDAIISMQAQSRPPIRETEGMLDGSDAMPTGALLNAPSTPLPVHLGFDPQRWRRGIGFSQHAGWLVAVADGTREFQATTRTRSHERSGNGSFAMPTPAIRKQLSLAPRTRSTSYLQPRAARFNGEYVVPAISCKNSSNASPIF